MSTDLIHERSPSALRQEIDALVAADPQALPPDAKKFRAVARLQGFDGLPARVSRDQLNILIAGGYVELNRGLASTASLAAKFYAEELLNGTMYPGTIAVYGQGIYLSEAKHPHTNPEFPKVSKVALRYATKGGVAGVVLRCGLKSSARTLSRDEVLELYRDDKNRVQRAGINDLGTFAAASGIDAYFIDNAFDYSDERTWVTVNRTALVFQSNGLKIAQKPS